MFGRKQDPPPTVDAPLVDEPPQPEPTGKGRPTPKRKEAEARNKRPLVPTDRRAAAREARARNRALRDLEYQAMRTGDERHMPLRDRGPVRRYVRDSVDSRWNLGEFFLPLAAVFLVLQFVTARNAPVVAFATLLLLYVYIIASMVDAWLMWRGLKKRLVAKFGEDKLPRGLTMYAVLRAFQVRPSRLPKPLVKHGQRPA
ncbi:DUF3043 domain-containing protein [Cellulomonas sp. zg-ZUI222]|uniref:DUF3043 domain-containing protein n=1 Tax=Cellulomonas wangleii TaxID=2816956 RepID=A0ABX8D3G7_9CELL|nr:MULTISPECIES: DUF3043 domain-containing protein [Cellulomonas]MBO0900098.1 DUF3043 domain-containing protein [Cellulomonas sp. zg-ZUI22]MBO0920987.1 DUF3043 domain-containing protein [Cellulomonas wangleii]MBO0925531.1 DUF3043 domain-containing protein [Cellulomonas wangleii]QVI61001.1 DUF3043 domain-containing protein [Cellulomonas wangleii]